MPEPVRLGGDEEERDEDADRVGGEDLGQPRDREPVPDLVDRVERRREARGEGGDREREGDATERAAVDRASPAGRTNPPKLRPDSRPGYRAAPAAPHRTGATFRSFAGPRDSGLRRPPGTRHGRRSSRGMIPLPGSGERG